MTEVSERERERTAGKNQSHSIGSTRSARTMLDLFVLWLLLFSRRSRKNKLINPIGFRMIEISLSGCAEKKPAQLGIRIDFSWRLCYIIKRQPLLQRLLYLTFEDFFSGCCYFFVASFISIILQFNVCRSDFSHKIPPEREKRDLHSLWHACERNLRRWKQLINAKRHWK